jgi:hypothetical protein
MSGMLLVTVLSLVGAQCLDDASPRRVWVWASGQNVEFNVTKQYQASLGEAGPGSRMFSSSTQINGDGYLFGGYGFTPFKQQSVLPSIFSDVWRYSAAQPHAWTQLTSGDANVGGRMQSVVFPDPSGVYVFGGTTRRGELKNDLWLYRFADDKWLSQPVTGLVPTPRTSPVSWRAGRKLYVFGGSSGAGLLADFWSYDLDGGRWSLIGGTNASDTVANYDTLWPGARMGACSWTLDSERTLLLFGGAGFAAERAEGMLGDTWAFDTASGRWSTSDERRPVNYKPDFAKENPGPEGRAFAQFWYDAGEGSAYVFGGEGVGRTLSDLWRYDATHRKWLLMSDGPQVLGELFYNAAGCYGAKNAPDRRNLLPGRRAGVAFFLGTGEAAVVGGVGANAKPYDGYSVVSDTWVLLLPTGGVNVPAIVVPILLFLLLLLLLLFFCLWRRWRRRYDGKRVVDLGGGTFKSNEIFKENTNQSVYDMADLLDGRGFADESSEGRW